MKFKIGDKVLITKNTMGYSNNLRTPCIGVITGVSEIYIINIPYWNNNFLERRKLAFEESEYIMLADEISELLYL